MPRTRSDQVGEQTEERTPSPDVATEHLETVGLSTLPAMPAIETEETPAASPASAPTLDDAFTTLCHALVARLPPEKEPLQARTWELARAYTDGNRFFAWQELFKVLVEVASVEGI